MKLQQEIEKEKQKVMDMEKRFQLEETRHYKAMNDKLKKMENEASKKEDVPSTTVTEEPIEIEKEKKTIQTLVEDKVNEIRKQKEVIAQKELLVSKIMQQEALCTLSVRCAPKTIVVSWCLGEDMKSLQNDWIGFYKVGHPPQQYRKCIKTGGARQGHEHVPAPKTPGLYCFKYFVNGGYDELVVSDVIHIGPQISINSRLVEDLDDAKRNTIHVEYILKGGELSTDDWFGLYKSTENNNRNYITYHKIGRVLGSSSFQIPAPRIPGDYVIRFFPSLCGYTFVAKSPLVRIPNRDKLTYELIKGDNDRVNTIKVKWDIHSIEPSTSDYIALYQHKDFNNYYLSYKYLDLSNNLLLFEAPVGVGKYNFRYHFSGFSKYVDLVTSEDFEILNTDKLTASVEEKTVSVTWDIHSQPITSWDWVGLYKRGTQSNKNYLDFKYVDISTKMMVFVVKDSGEYEVKYFSAKVGKYEDFRSVSFEVK